MKLSVKDYLWRVWILVNLPSGFELFLYFSSKALVDFIYTWCKGKSKGKGKAKKEWPKLTDCCVFSSANGCSTRRSLVEIICFCVKTSFFIFFSHKWKKRKSLPSTDLGMPVVLFMSNINSITYMTKYVYVSACMQDCLPPCCAPMHTFLGIGENSIFTTAWEVGALTTLLMTTYL